MAGQNVDELRLRVIVSEPPDGVRFRMQSGAADLVPPAAESRDALRFDFAVRLGKQPGGAPNFLGPFAQGPPSTRFVYINSGTLAGQADSCWTRRAKVPLTGIGWKLIEAARRRTSVIETTIPGVGRDGGPICASVKAVVWRVASH